MAYLSSTIARKDTKAVHGSTNCLPADAPHGTVLKSQDLSLPPGRFLVRITYVVKGAWACERAPFNVLIRDAANGALVGYSEQSHGVEGSDQQNWIELGLDLSKQSINRPYRIECYKGDPETATILGMEVRHLGIEDAGGARRRILIETFGLSPDDGTLAPILEGFEDRYEREICRKPLGLLRVGEYILQFDLSIPEYCKPDDPVLVFQLWAHDASVAGTRHEVFIRDLWRTAGGWRFSAELPLVPQFPAHSVPENAPWIGIELRVFASGWVPFRVTGLSYTFLHSTRMQPPPCGPAYEIICRASGGTALPLPGVLGHKLDALPEPDDHRLALGHLKRSLYRAELYMQREYNWVVPEHIAFSFVNEKGEARGSLRIDQAQIWQSRTMLRGSTTLRIDQLTSDLPLFLLRPVLGLGIEAAVLHLHRIADADDPRCGLQDKIETLWRANQDPYGVSLAPDDDPATSAPCINWRLTLSRPRIELTLALKEIGGQSPALRSVEPRVEVAFQLNGTEISRLPVPARLWNWEQAEWAARWRIEVPGELVGLPIGLSLYSRDLRPFTVVDASVVPLARPVPLLEAPVELLCRPMAEPTPNTGHKTGWLLSPSIERAHMWLGNVLVAARGLLLIEVDADLFPSKSVRDLDKRVVTRTVTLSAAADGIIIAKKDFSVRGPLSRPRTQTFRLRLPKLVGSSMAHVIVGVMNHNVIDVLVTDVRVIRLV